MSIWKNMTEEERNTVEAVIVDLYTTHDGAHAKAKPEFVTWLHDQDARGVEWARKLLNEFADKGAADFCQARWNADHFAARVGAKVRQRRAKRGVVKRDTSGQSVQASLPILGFSRPDLIAAINGDLALISELKFNVGYLRSLLDLVERTGAATVEAALLAEGWADIETYLQAASA